MEHHPDPEPLEIDARIPTGVGTAGWAVALVVLLILGDRVPPGDRWWIWTCVTGICLGGFGFWYAPRLIAKRNASDHR